MRWIYCFSVFLPLSVYFVYLSPPFKKVYRPNILVFSIENLYLKKPLKDDVFFLNLSKFANQNNLELINKIDKEGPIPWLKKIESWPDDIWIKSGLRQIGLGSDLLTNGKNEKIRNKKYFIQVLNDTKIIPYTNLLIKKKFLEKNTSPFFLLLNFYYLLPPLYDLDLAEAYDAKLSVNSRELLRSYSLEPERYKNKSFVFSTLFDDYHFSRLTSFQSAKISSEITQRDFTFWSDSYSEFSGDSTNINDIRLIDELYSIKINSITNTTIDLLNELKKNDSLKNTLIIFSNGIHTNDPKNKFYKKLFSMHLQKESYFLILGNKKVILEQGLSENYDNSPDKKIFNFIKRY